VFGDQRNEELQNESLRLFAILAASHDLLKAFCHLVGSTASYINPVVAEDWFLPNRQKEVERRNVFRDFRELDAIDRIKELRIEIVNPELVEIAEDDERRPFRNNVRPVIESLVVMLLKIFAARLHFDEHAVRPE